MSRWFAALALLLVACPRSATVDSASAEPVAAPGGPAVTLAEPELVPLGEGESACASSADCPEGWFCSSPETAGWNHCGHPTPPDCPQGWVGDDCGGCHRGCSAEQTCPGGLECSGGLCVSPARCHVETMTPV